MVSSDPHLKIRVLEILGNIDLNQNVRAALDDWKNVLMAAQSVGDARWINRANGYLGIVSGLNGDIGGAGKALFQALGRAEESGDVPGELTFGIWLGNGMSNNGMADGALHVLNRVEESAKKSGYTQMPAQFYIAKVRALSLSKDPNGREEAAALLQVALADARRQRILGAQTDLLGQAGLMAITDRNYRSAEKDFMEEVRIAKQASLPSMEAGGLLHLSQVYRALQENAKAELAINQAIDATRQVAESYELPNFIAEKAEVELALGHLKTADVLYDQAARMVQGLLMNAPSSRVKSSMIGSMSEIYLGHFRLAWNHMYDASRAFQIIESARGSALVTTLGSPIRMDEKSNSELEISRLQSTLLHSRLGRDETERVLVQLDRAYDRAFPLQYEQSRKEVSILQPMPVSLDALRQQLRSGETLVEYVLDSNASYALEITKEGLTVHSLPGRSEIDQLAKEFLAALKSNTDSNGPGMALYKSLILPALSHQTDSLIVVPDGSLHSIPFEAFVDPHGAYLIQNLAVFSVPSASVYSKLKTTATERPPTKPFLGVAYSPQAGRARMTDESTRGLFDLRGVDLTPLPYAREEVEKAAAAFGRGAVTLDGDAASETAVKAEPLADFKVIHLAAHAVGNDMEPDRAALILAAGNDTEDGLWQAREIRRSRLNAEAIVLSACETGVGRLQGEEGVMNLARAFFVGGAKSVVASLWKVEDRSTATVMESFYQHLAAGQSVGSAFRQAQLDFIKDYGLKAKPYLWAGFEVIGDGTRRINFETNKTFAGSAH
jgi:CHAT domain-containing protein